MSPADIVGRMKGSSTTLRRLARRTARRREQITRLERQVEILTEEVLTPLQRTVRDAPDPELAPGTPSYTLSARLHRRANTTGVYTRAGLREPVLQLSPKPPGQRYAAAHGVLVPEVLGRWPDPGAVDWDSLPERFVLKSNIGGGGINVFPLVRDPDTGGYTDMLTGDRLTREEVLERLWSRHTDRSEYFVEEFLVGRTGEPGEVPSDIKVFCFYGEPVYVEVRRNDHSRAKNTTPRVRSFSADGTELHDVRALMAASDGAVLAPTDFAAVADAAARLSRGIRRPLERLDLFETDRGLVFGEVTQNPGHPPMLVPEWDRRMGEAYEAAYARLLGDLAAEGALHVDEGEDAQRR